MEPVAESPPVSPAGSAPGSVTAFIDLLEGCGCGPYPPPPHTHTV